MVLITPISIWCVFILSIPSLSIYHPNPKSYRAGIVQLLDRTSVISLLPYISESKEREAEIIVFPELSVIQLPDDPSTFEAIEIGSTPCHSWKLPIQSNISCAAKRNQIYVVFDMVEKGEDCEKTEKYCSYGFFVHNTAVIMDRNGTIIQKYRKINPVGNIFKPGYPVLTSFLTDFGVEFGVFICFDIIFKMPSESIIRKNRLNNIIFPTFWFDSFFIDGTPLQQSYSEYYQVNFLAANSLGQSEGSGIFTKGKPLVTSDQKKSELMVADVPIFDFISPPPSGPSSPAVVWNEEKDTKIVFPNTQKEGVFHFSGISTISCDIQYRVRQSFGTESFLIGSARFQDGEVRTGSCVVLNCGNIGESYASLENCTKILDPMTTFEFLQVNVTLKENIRMVYPLIGSTEKGVVSAQSFEGVSYVHEKNFHSVTLSGVDDPIAFVAQFGVF